MADKLRTLQTLEHLSNRHIGIGHPDTRPYNWMSNIHRDSLASYIGHPALLQYMALGMGESREVVRGRMVEGMVRPGGNPPVEEED